MNTCEAKIKNNQYGKIKPYCCGKTFKFQDENGRQLCSKHFKKWFKKKYGKEYNEFLKESI